jgi:hypothetical protein
MAIANADEYVNGYYKKNGTYVEGYNRTSSNSTKDDNYSTKGNQNPYTGTYGTKKNDYESQDQNTNYNYNSGSNSNYNSNRRHGR